MTKTMKDLKVIERDLLRRKPPKRADLSARILSNKEIILALAPVLNRMKERGFTVAELAAVLAEHQIDIKAATLNRYLIGSKMETDGRARHEKADRVNGDLIDQATEGELEMGAARSV